MIELPPINLKTLKCPTADECNTKAKVCEDDMRIGYAIWYPQMGGYSGKAIVIVNKSEGHNSCFEAYVWHDGEFPFSDDGGVWEKTGPVNIHHCDPDQFISFGKAVEKMMGISSEGVTVEI